MNYPRAERRIHSRKRNHRGHRHISRICPLVLSMLSVILSVAGLATATWAWFTGYSVADKNDIQTGLFSIGLYKTDDAMTRKEEITEENPVFEGELRPGGELTARLAVVNEGETFTEYGLIFTIEELNDGIIPEDILTGADTDTELIENDLPDAEAPENEGNIAEVIDVFFAKTDKKSRETGPYIYLGRLNELADHVYTPGDETDEAVGYDGYGTDGLSGMIVNDLDSTDDSGSNSEGSPAADMRADTAEVSPAAADGISEEAAAAAAEAVEAAAEAAAEKETEINRLLDGTDEEKPYRIIRGLLLSEEEAVEDSKAGAAVRTYAYDPESESGAGADTYPVYGVDSFSIERLRQSLMSAGKSGGAGSTDVTGAGAEAGSAAPGDSEQLVSVRLSLPEKIDEKYQNCSIKIGIRLIGTQRAREISTLTAYSSDESKGLVTGGGTYHRYITDGDGIITDTTQAVLTPVPKEGYRFSKWRYGITGTKAPDMTESTEEELTVSLDNDYTCIAEFVNDTEFEDDDIPDDGWED